MISTRNGIICSHKLKIALCLDIWFVLKHEFVTEFDFARGLEFATKFQFAQDKSQACDFECHSLMLKESTASFCTNPTNLSNLNMQGFHDVIGLKLQIIFADIGVVINWLVPH